MNIINDLKQEWNNMKEWKKILVGILLLLILTVLILTFFNITKPVYILWAIVVIVFIFLMICGKKGLKFE